jgi:SAM-dependent methyltransferase
LHQSAFEHMRRETERLIRRDPSYTVIDFGSQAVNDQALTHRSLFDGCRYIGVDIFPGPNVDVVMRKPYRIPLPSASADLVISGQVFEHIPFPWVSILELARVLKPGGHMVLIAPSRGHKHSKLDCWRYYPDGYRALASFARLRVVKTSADFPNKRDAEKRWDYASVPEGRYWGDCLAVLRKSRSRIPDPRIAMLRTILSWWANGRDISGSHSA